MGSYFLAIFSNLGGAVEGGEGRVESALAAPSACRSLKLDSCQPSTLHRLIHPQTHAHNDGSPRKVSMFSTVLSVAVADILLPTASCPPRATRRLRPPCRHPHPRPPRRAPPPLPSPQLPPPLTATARPSARPPRPTLVTEAPTPNAPSPSTRSSSGARRRRRAEGRSVSR